MPTLTLDVPAEMLAALEKKATQKKCSVEDEILAVLGESVCRATSPSRPRQPGPVFFTDEIVAPFDIPHPPGVRVRVVDRGPRRPDPLMSLDEEQG